MTEFESAPGTYDAECTVAREQTQGELVAVIVLNGAKGTGFSVQALDPMLVVMLPSLLRMVADDIEKKGPIKMPKPD